MNSFCTPEPWASEIQPFHKFGCELLAVQPELGADDEGGLSVSESKWPSADHSDRKTRALPMKFQNGPADVQYLIVRRLLKLGRHFDGGKSL